MINLIMPMAGRGSRFISKGVLQPKPLIDINGYPFFYWATESIKKHTEIAKLVFVVLDEHVLNNNIYNIIIDFYPDAEIVILPDVLNGPVLTSLEGIKLIDNLFPVVFNDCDHMFDAPQLYHLCNRKIQSDPDGAILTFNSNEDKFSYVQLDYNGFVQKTVEKVVVSDMAICGAYWFRNRYIFKNAAVEYLNKCDYHEFFMSGIYNIMIEYEQKVIPLKVSRHVSFGTPEEYSHAIKSSLFKEYK